VWTVLGHDRAVSLLKRSIERGNFSHAYLFVGPPHVGKMTLARNFAQALNCPLADRPCGVCPSCRRIEEGKHADVQIIELEQAPEGGETAGKTRISVEQVDDILHSVSLPPFEGVHKVFIIDGAEFMSIGAANRLLKTLEEPLSKVVFILLTLSEAMVPATVVSRCQRLELYPMPIAQVGSALMGKWGVEREKANLLARLSGGCLGWAVTMARDEAQFQQRSDWLDEWLEVMGADMDRRFTFVSRMVERFSQNRETVQQRLALLRDWWRDVLLAKTGNEDAVANVDRLEGVKETAAAHSLRDIRASIGRIEAAMLQLKQNVNPQLALEVLMLNVPERARVNKVA
jgi:DNA polymerase-3 subunit delta'